VVEKLLKVPGRLCRWTRLALHDLRSRPSRPDVPIVTGYATLATAIAAGYVIGPVELDALDTRTREVLDRRRIVAETARRHEGLVEHCGKRPWPTA
jgi:hypothetical protein